jgi:transformation/transcription domain-associated protein
LNLDAKAAQPVVQTPQNAAQAAQSIPQDSQKASPLIKSTQSFKVLTECPIIVVLLFQLYPKFLTSNIPKFMPLIVNTLGLSAPAAAKVIGSPLRQSYIDFIAAQVKVKVFLVSIDCLISFFL